MSLWDDAQRIGEQLKEWKEKLSLDPAADIVVPTTGSKRKAVNQLLAAREERPFSMPRCI